MYCKKNYYCNSDKIIVVINLQKSNFDNSYYINYGFYVKDIHNDLHGSLTVEYQEKYLQVL